MVMTILRTAAELRETVGAWKREGLSVAVVPTMGALHEGHLSLVRAASARADRVIVTIFVNPRQFNNAADLDAYPRTEQSDAAKLNPLGVDLLYVPGVEEIYPEGFRTTVSVAGLTDGLCGAGRPGHFDGVATVVAKLFLQTQADLAFFGEKDFQQLHVVRRMARDLDIPIEVVGCETVRETDGLALSSRNVRLTGDQRSVASQIAAVLATAAEALGGGDEPVDVLADAGKRLDALPEARLEYLELRDAETLAPLDRVEGSARLLAAVWLGEVRLIDNVAVRVERSLIGDMRSAA